MATMTPSTFDPLLRYVNVRLQQGVPLVDADLNELDDVRKFELRAFLKWFVGNGVPEGNDGFRIVGGLDNDFTIAAGVSPAPGGTPPAEAGLRNVGRLLIDGLDALIETDLRYAQQKLHVSQAGSAELAAKLGVPVVPALTTPTVDGTVVAYLDLWERLVTPDDVPDLIHPGLGVETCARVKREWVVRVGSSVPAAANGHLYYGLATIGRRAGVARIGAGDVADRREQRLIVPPAHLLADVLGVEPVAYRQGAGRPLVNLRDAINALLAGQLPTTADLPVSPGAGPDVLRRGCLAVDTAGGLVVAWQSPRMASTNQIALSRLDLARVGDGFPAATMVTSGGVHLEPSIVPLAGGEVLVAYQNGPADGTTTDVLMRRGAPGTLGAEQPISTTANAADQSPMAVVSGDQVVFFVNQVTATDNRWFVRRYRHTDNTFPDPSPVQLAATQVTTRDLHAAAAGGMVWVAFGDGANLQLLRYNPATGAKDATTTIVAAGTLDVHMLAISATSAMVFYDDGTVLRTVSFANNAWGTSVPVTGTDASDAAPAAIRDADGTVYLVSQRPVGDAGNEIVLRRRNAVTGDWTQPQRLSPNPANDQRPFPVFIAGQGIWVLWMSDRAGTFDVYAKRIVTVI
jgi:hypothetical protein